MLSGKRLFAAADCNPDKGYVQPSCFPAGQYQYYLWATVDCAGTSYGPYLLTWNGSTAYKSAVIQEGCLTSGTIVVYCLAGRTIIEVQYGAPGYNAYPSPELYDPVYLVSYITGLPLGPATITVTSAPTSGHPFDPLKSGITSGLRAMYRLATLASGMYSGSMLSGMLSGRRLYAAERDPCCDGGPFAPVVNSGIVSGDGGGEATCYCGTHPIPATLYATTQDAVSGVFPLYYTGTTGGPYPAEQCINFLSDPDIVIGGTHYRFKFSICCSGFGRSLVLEIRDSAGSTILCAGYPTGLANCPPVYLTYYFFASSCSLLSPDDLQVTITETSP
jgi:hypothetical protein